MTLPASALDLRKFKISTQRIQTIDLLRGIVMVLMTLDHVRDYFHADAFLYDPLDIQKTAPAVFFTRWITHFCAPVFILLAGTSAFLSGVRKGRKELSSFLVKRGLWLIVLEFTVMNFAWFFNVSFSILVLQVIGAIGIGMIILSFMVRFSLRTILVTGVVLVAGHNLMDSIHVPGTGLPAVGWSLLHEFRAFEYGDVLLFIGYPIIPWTGIMLLGYCLGRIYQPSFDRYERRTILLITGLSAVLLFLLLRLTNIYGDPRPWEVQDSNIQTIMSFLSVSKYPPSLLYALITLGPALIFLALAEKLKGKTASYMIALGRVPMFYYILHVYVIHLLAMLAAVFTGYHITDMIFTTWITDAPELKGYGFSLPATYGVWCVVLAILIPVSLRYEKYKSRNRDKWWISYL
jgi:uncharacterized membrane protein